MCMQDFIRINREDTVAVALRPLEKGTTVTFEDGSITLAEDIMQGHKFALAEIGQGEPVIKYGARIGIAKTAIHKGEWVHTHNLKTALGEVLEYRYEPQKKLLKKQKSALFMGFERADGRVGIRNEIWILPTAGCVNSGAKSIESKAKARFAVGEGVEDIIAFQHPYGCSQMGDDQENTRMVLSDIVHHLNAAGVLVLGLGCENSNIPVLMDYIGAYEEKRIKFLVCQEVEDEEEEALCLIGEIYREAKEDRRKPCDVSKLIVGMKCGGSDGLSGITANPVVGAFSDLLIAQGGTTILTEVPEMFGAETYLMNRCMDREIFEKTVDLINDFKNYFMRHGQTIYENPSPGNKMGGGYFNAGR